MAHYFRRIPEFVYPSQLNSRSSNLDNTNVKNFFRRFKLRPDLENSFTAFEEYRIEGDERPDQVADYFYEDPTLDWVILSVNNIINMLIILIDTQSFQNISHFRICYFF